ncbi:hypothetical protein CCHOA_02085 [Corynebacterium choanae]|uniref:Uncharacterized protein n=1 Tax=Corynebacterium choanae TaxID=1862358 RepID=A0A3G6J4H9_9CORY|nr:hypothetical protein CCHOA_02085 [Corynebacterium choanae]
MSLRNEVAVARIAGLSFGALRGCRNGTTSPYRARIPQTLRIVDQLMICASSPANTLPGRIAKARWGCPANNEAKNGLAPFAFLEMCC